MARKLRWLFFLVLVVGSLLVFLSIEGSRFFSISARAEYSYVFLIVPTSATIIYLERRRIFSAGSSRSIDFKIIAALFVAEIAIISACFVIPDALAPCILALIVFWVTSFTLCFGSVAVTRARFALLFLLLMIPIPDSLLNKIIHFLQVQSADAAYALFRITGVPVIRTGQVFTLVSQQILVAEECSGIRSSITLLLTGIVFSHMFLASRVNKALLIMVTVPLAVFKNGLRIFVLSVLGTYVDPSFLSGPLHHRGGVLFFAITLALLVLLLWCLRRLEEGSVWGLRLAASTKN